MSVTLKGSYDAIFYFSFSLVCYVAVCACIRSAEIQSSKYPTKVIIVTYIFAYIIIQVHVL